MSCFCALAFLMHLLLAVGVLCRVFARFTFGTASTLTIRWRAQRSLYRSCCSKPFKYVRCRASLSVSLDTTVMCYVQRLPNLTELRIPLHVHRAEVLSALLPIAVSGSSDFKLRLGLTSHLILTRCRRIQSWCHYTSNKRIFRRCSPLMRRKKTRSTRCLAAPRL